MSGRILIVEDDDAIATGLSLNLKLAGYTAAIARDGDDAIRQINSEDFALVLLDINLPKKNGLEVLSTMRAADNLVPVVVLSAREGEFDKVAALRLGADDYVTKPFALAELLARVDAVLRRANHASPPPPTPPPDDHLGFDDVRLDLTQHVVTRGGKEVKLTHVWGQSAGSVRTVDNFVGQLRKRFEDNPEQPAHFITVRGSGYRFDP